MKSFFKNNFAVIILLVLVVFFFLPYLSGQVIPYSGDYTGSDLTELNLPLRFSVAQSIQHGQMPLWTNSIANGFPVLSEGQSGVFYLPNLLYTFLPFNFAVNFSLILNFFLAGFFLYLYCRILKISRFGSLLGALAFSFSGFFVFRLKHLNIINAAIWLPLIFYLLEKYFTTKKKPLVLASLGLVFAMQFFAGHPQISYISFVSVFANFFGKIFFEKKLDAKQVFKQLFCPWLIVVCVFLGLVAVQFLPTFFYAGQSGRSLAINYSQIQAYPYSFHDLWYLVAPYFWGNPARASYPTNPNIVGVFWENNIYFGIVPLLLSLLAAVFLLKKNSTVKILLCLIFLAFFFSLAAVNPLFGIFWQFFPGLSMFRFPQRFLLLALVCLTTLAGFGFDFLMQKILAWHTKFPKLIRSELTIKVFLPLIIILLAAINLFSVGYNYIGSLDYHQYFSPPQSVQFLKSDSDNFRIYSVGWPSIWQSVYKLSGGWQNNLYLYIASRELLAPNSNIYWGIASAQDRGFLEGGLLNKEAQQLTNDLMFTSFGEDKKAGEITVSDQALKIFGLQNVKYFLSYKKINNNNLKLVKEVKADLMPALNIYQNQYFLPPAFGVFSVINSTSTQAALPMLFEQSFDPQKQIILPQGFMGLVPNDSSGTAKVVVTQPQAGRIIIQADFSQPGYLFLSQANVSGWQAEVDDKKVNILPADYAFMAVAVPAGNHEILFYFRPASFLIGQWLTAITIFIIVIFLFYYFKHGRS